jgi:ribonuclease J
MTESDLEKKAVGLFQEYEGPVFILQAATNIDRLVSMYKAAKRSRRLFLQDLYMAEITSAIRKSIPDPLNHIDVKVFTDKGYNGNHPRYQMLNQYKGNKIGKAEIVGERFAMCVRSSMLHYLEGLNKILSFDKGLLVYSMWEGYKDQPGMKAFLDACERMGLTVVSLHTSGHADKKAIKGLVDHVHPDKIMPIHTLNPRGFHEFEGIRIQVVTQSELTI